MARHNVIYIKAWCSHDNLLGKAVPGTPNLDNEIWGRGSEGILGLVSMIFVLLSCVIDSERSPWSKIFRQVLPLFAIMAPLRVLMLGHSFIRRLHTFLLRNFNAQIADNFSLPGDLVIRWHGIGGRTVFKTKKFDLSAVEDFAPDVVVLQLGTNDLANTSAVETGSAIEDLCRLLHESYGVQVICVCQTLHRHDAPLFNRQVNLLSQYLKVVLEPLSYTIYWRHRGFWRAKSRFLVRDGVHLNNRGNYKYFRSLRGAVLRCRRFFTAR